ncbi:hypothetical protein [Marinagarivorans cellulosilyticus]|uniref:hypothetical protein n=1 Tax=Marinagarivorans cellulosilyticus TaxID=2721545 RepID=UPI001F29B359|nr:hypothetical protein [Marinagarivorans cellulosilyticus]
MSNRKAPERRSTIDTRQDNSDLNIAITELHQTIVRLNKVIDRVKPEQRLNAKLGPQELNADHDAASDELCLASLNIPKVFH